MSAPIRRRNRLPKPSLQLRLIGAFLGVCALSLLLQILLLGLRLTELSADLPLGGEEISQRLPDLLLELLLYSFGLLLPATIGIGILITFRTAGPIYRFEKYLGQVARGEDVGPCRIRKGDELQGLCDVINEALAVTRENARREREEEPASREAS